MAGRAMDAPPQSSNTEAGGSSGSGQRLLTPSEITAWLECDHYLTLRNLEDARTQMVASEGMGSFARLLLDKGLQHEGAYLRALREDQDVFEVPERAKYEPFADWAARVVDVLAQGHDVVYQMPFVHDGMRGVADFLIKVETPSALGDFSYEPVDAKLARAEAKPGHVLQLCFYADALAAAQELAPQRAHLYLGSGQTEIIQLADVGAYWRRIRTQLRAVMAAGPLEDTAPVPCSHCSFCEFQPHCDAQWRADDALHYVAGARSTEIAALQAIDITTMADLAVATPAGELRAERFDDLQQQAALQIQARTADVPPHETRPVPDDVLAADRRLLPPADAGDVFIDYEGHPFWTPARGLFFLVGLLYRGGDGDWTYDAWWSHDLDTEGASTKRLIEWLAQRRSEHPGMHVYHYNHTERSSLERLAAEHGADEVLLRELIEQGVFVDLYEVVRNLLRVGAESSSLKVLELLAGYQRGHDIDQGAGAVIEYDEWCRDREPSRLASIASYNEDDVRATLAVRDWLLSEPLAGQPYRRPFEPEQRVEPQIDEVVAGLMNSGEDWKELLAHLIGYWGREGGAHRAQNLPAASAPDDERFVNPAVITGLELLEVRPPTGRATLNRAVFRFPDQELTPKLGPGSRLMYPLGQVGVASETVQSLDAEGNEMVVSWHEQEVDTPEPAAMVINDWVPQEPKPAAATDYAEKVLADQAPASDVRQALLRRDLPRFHAGKGPPGGAFTTDRVEIVRAAASLDRSYLAVQGPPGTGKTYTGAKVIAQLIDQGFRVGVTAFSHAAIDNLVVAVVGERPSTRVLRHRSKPEDPARVIPGATYNGDGEKWAEGDYDLLAGTTWMLSNDKAKDALDILVIDEAGQMGLADAIAALRSASNVILLGDPLQLAQVRLATHPGGANASVLEHVLGDHATIPDDRGVFLDTTWRMHPDLCAFLSEQIYDGRLTSHPNCAHQSVGGEAGLRWVRAEHDGCETSSQVEAELVADTIRSLLGREWVDFNGDRRPLTAEDVMVVAPYNDQVNLVRSMLETDPELVDTRVGTVDKFQGQEAPVVIFTMATSDSAHMPRTSEFLYSRNRLNVALSRARALAYVICTEDLLDARARTVEEMRLIGTLCAFAEAAVHVDLSTFDERPRASST